jgi:hypothetical protein
MKKIALILILFITVFMACEKNENTIKVEKEYPKEVIFNYNGKSETYGVIKRIYIKDAKGQDISSNPVEKLWLDRNLGALQVAKSKNDSLASGDLFQWGRLADGHQIKYSSTLEVLSQSQVPNHGKYITKPLNASDWQVTSNDALWNQPANTNCPCPDGWRVPTVDEYKMEMLSWNKLSLDAAFQSPLKFVSGGNRDNNGTVRYADYWGFYWTSTTKPKSEAFSIALISGDTAEVSSAPRIYANSIRCVKDY